MKNTQNTSKLCGLLALQDLCEHSGSKHSALICRQGFKLADSSWCFCVELDVAQQRLFCFSDHNLLCYDMIGSLVTKLNITQDSMVLSSFFSLCAMMLFTAAVDHKSLTEENLLYLWSPRSIHLYHLNHFLDFWGYLHYLAVVFSLCRAPGKTTLLLTLREDNRSLFQYY
ncbi:hypothetical protein MHYP_G00080030 [Metynnis hypsauchen]